MDIKEFLEEFKVTLSNKAINKLIEQNFDDIEQMFNRGFDDLELGKKNLLILTSLRDGFFAAKPDAIRPTKHYTLSKTKLTNRAKNALEEHNTRSIDSLLALSYRDIRQIPNLGLKSSCEVCGYIAAYRYFEKIKTPATAKLSFEIKPDERVIVRLNTEKQGTAWSMAIENLQEVIENLNEKNYHEIRLTEDQ